MRSVTYLVASSVDGRIAMPDGSFDCFPQDDQLVGDYLAMLEKFDTVLMGRGTYEVALRIGVTDPYPKMKSYVFSSTLPDSAEPNVQVVRGDPVRFVSDLKTTTGGDIYLCGASQLAATLFAANLVDYLLLKLNPLVIGAGMPLFTPERIPAPRQLELLTPPKQYPSGILLLTYRVR